MGYEQALGRVQEIRAMSSGTPLASTAAPTGATPSQAAQFQAQLLARTQSGAASPLPGVTDPALAGGGSAYAMLQGGGLATQALLAQPPAEGTQPAALTHVRGKIDNVDPELLGRLDALGKQLGRPIDVISGFRSYEEQQRLHQAYLNGTGNLAAPPGSSNHERRAAVDAYVGGVALADVAGARDAAAALGLHFPVSGEAWHVERSDR